MAAREHETGKNYIELLHEEADEPRVDEMPPAAVYPILDHILDLVAAMFNRRREAN
jgi:hypothetical protein